MIPTAFVYESVQHFAELGKQQLVGQGTNAQNVSFVIFLQWSFYRHKLFLMPNIHELVVD